MVVLAPGSAYVQGTDLLLSSRRQHALTKLQRQSDRVAPGSRLTFALSHGPVMLTVFLEEKSPPENCIYITPVITDGSLELYLGEI